MTRRFENTRDRLERISEEDRARLRLRRIENDIEDLPGGNVFKVGTPANNQIAVWTSDGFIEGDPNFQWTDLFLQFANGLGINWIDGVTPEEFLIFETVAGGDTEVQILADMDGADGATSFTEESQNTASMTFVAGAELDTAQFNSGTASLLLDRATSDFASFPDISAFDMDTGDWTVEGFVRLLSLPAIGFTSDPGYCMASLWDDAGVKQFRYEIIRDGFGTRIKIAGDGYSEQGTVSGGIALNTWFHWAITRESGQIRAYFNGNHETGDFGGAPADMGGTAAPFRIGQSDGIGRTDFLDGWIDDVRYTVGTARYTGTGSYVVPTTPFPPSVAPGAGGFSVGNVGFNTNILGLITNIQSPATDIDGTLNVDGAVDFGLTLDVVGAVDFDSTLNVDGTATVAQLIIAPLVINEPILKWIDDNGAADNKAWRTIVDAAGLTWSLQTANDADSFFADAMTATRTFGTVSNVTFPVPVFITDEMQFFDDNPCQFGTGFDISLIWDSTASALEVESASTNQTWVFRNGMHVVMTGVGNDETVDWHHDETDLNTVFVNTVDWNITGLTGGVVLGTGVDFTSDFFRTITAANGGLEANNLLTGAGFERVLTTADIATGGASLAAAYRFDTSIVEADPGNGDFRMDNATPASVTELFISSITDNGNDFDTILGLVSSGDQIYIQQDNDATKFILFNVTANVDNTGWWSIAGTIAASGTIFDSNAKCHILIIFGGSGAFGDVFKVGTPLDNQFGIWTGDGTIEGDTNFTFDSAASKYTVGVPIYLDDRPAALGSFAGQGQFWVRDDVQTAPMFTNSFGTDVLLAGISAGAATSRVAFFTNAFSIEGDANFTYGLGGNPEQLMVQVVTNTINEVGLLIIDSDSVLNPDGWQFCPGQGGLHDGTLILTHKPADTINNRDLTMIPGARPSFGFGVAIPANQSFASETAGALAYFMPQDVSGREETKISFVGEVGGTGHEGVFSIEGFAYGDSGLQFHRMAHFVIDADYTLHTDLFGTLQLGTLGAAAPVANGDNAAIGYSPANGLELTGQGTTNDFVIFDDTLQLALSKPTGSAGFRFHQRFSPTRFTEFKQDNTDFLITSEANVGDFLISGYGGLLDIASDLTVEGIRPSGTVEWDKGADIASATTLVLGADGNSFDVTGTTDIEAISAKPIGTIIVLTFDAVATMIHDATALDMSGDVDMVPEANDTLGMHCYDGTNWRELFRTDGQNVRVSGSIADTAMVRGNGGAKRVQDTGNLIGDDDEIIMAGLIQLQTFTDTQLNDITDGVNTGGSKVQGAMAYNTTQDVPVWAVGAADGSVWVDGAGTTVNTPV